ncbi:hypothetical protein Bca101_023197 [Brassica carinata]
MTKSSSLKRRSGSPGLMLFPKDGGCLLYNPKEGTFQRKLGDFSGCRFLANSGNWLLVLDSGSNLYIVDVFSEKKIRLPSLESIVKRVEDTEIFERHDSDGIFRNLSCDVHCGYNIRRVLLVESDPRNRTWFRLYKKNPDVKNPHFACYTVTEVDSLGGETLLLDLGFTVPANKALSIEPDTIYFTRHYRPCQCARRDLDICAFNLVTKTLVRFPDLNKMNLMDARWFLPGN